MKHNIRKSKSKKGITVTPQQRADQFPDDFTVKDNALYCKYCNRYICHNRKDNVMEHLYSKLHRETSNRILKRSKPKIKITVKNSSRRRSGAETSSQDETSQDESLLEEDAEEDIKNLFDDSDSSSFEGFGEDSEDKKPTTSEEARKSGRSRKKPARLSEIEEDLAIINRKRKAESQPESSSAEEKKKKLESSTEIPIRSMPIKKQISYNIRKTSENESALEKTGLLKMKISRNRSKKSSDSSDNFDESSKKDDIKVVSSKVQSGALKMKFVLKSKTSEIKETKKTLKSPPRKAKTATVKLETPEIITLNRTRQKSKEEEKKIETPKQSRKSEPKKSETPKIVETKTPKSLPKVNRNTPKADKPPAKVEKTTPKAEKITSKVDQFTPKVVKPAPKVVKSAPKVVKPAPKVVTPSPKVGKSTSKIAKTVAQSSAKESNASTKIPMVKKQKGITKNPKTTVQDKKKKVTGYMLWSKNMRTQISTQYPGLDFGDVSKKLGDLWKKLSLKEKQMWHVRSIKMNNGGAKMTSHDLNDKPVRKAGGRMIETGPKKKIARVKPDILNYQTVSKYPDVDMEKELEKLSKPSSEVVDVAAHFSLLGESFMDLHSKVSQSNAEITMRDAQGTLMDGLLSCLVPLMALTKQVPCLKGAIAEEDFQESLANIAQIVPGL